MNFKKFWPIENYVLISKLSIEEIKKRISENVEPIKRFRLGWGDWTKPYQGGIYNDTFEMTRFIYIANPFQPIIKGDIINYPEQTIIKIKMRPRTFVLIFMGLWLSGAGFFCLVSLVGMLIQLFSGNFFAKGDTQNGFSLFYLIPFIMFLFGWLFMFLGFKTESNDSKQFISSLLEAQETNNQ